MGRKKTQEKTGDEKDDSEDDVFKPRTTRSQKPKTTTNRTSTKSKPPKKSQTACHVPTESKPPEPEDVKEKESTVPQKNEFCPICQVPLSILKITPANHTANCNISANLPACPEENNCLNTNIFHYRDYSHHILAAFRVSEEYVEPDIIFTPQKAKMKRTPLRTSGKKRPSTSPALSASKICKTDEASCSQDIFLESPSIPSTSCGVEERKKRLSFNSNKDHTESDPDDPEIPANLHETDVILSDLILSEELKPLELFSHQPFVIKREPSSPNSMDESSLPKLIAPNAKVMIDYNQSLTSNCDQEIVGNKVECTETCEETLANEDSLQANCSIVLKKHGLKSPMSVNLYLNNSGWEAIEVNSSVNTSLQKLKISLCKCSSSICVDCSLGINIANGDENSIPNDHQQLENFFVSMVEMGLKDPPLNCDILSKENYQASCNQITVSSVAQNKCVPVENGQDQVLREVDSDKIGTKPVGETSKTDKVLDAFSVLKRTSADGRRKSATLAAPLSGLNSAPTGVPMVVSKTTGSSWTLVPSKENKTKSSSGWGQPSSNKKLPAYKKIPDTPFVVDAFSYGIIPGIKIYFLSHFHSDHYIGLRKDFNMPIFCSQVTANLVNLKIKVDKKYLHILKIDEPRMVCGVEVEVFDANHCPGAIMFLFRLADGRVFLHVGDFRAHTSMEEFPQLRQVDKLYLDTTYCDPSYNFPSQEEVVEKVIQTAREHLSRNKSTLIVCGTYTIGKEKVFMGLANAFNMKIWTATEKRRVLLCLEDQNIIGRLTNDPLEAQIHVLAMRDISFEILPKHLSKYSSKYSHALGFKPTGWTTSTSIKGKPSDFQKNSRGQITIYGVPYSEHSSFSELRQFVRFVNPRDIQVTVNVSKTSQYRKLFQQWLSTSRDIDTQSKMNQYFSTSK